MNLNLKHPVFTTQQTDSIFILTSHLKGYGRRDINIEINEDGSRIKVSGEQVETMRRFCKIFTIPEGVVLSRVTARFDQDKSSLAIRMPKSVKGITEFGIQELKDTENSGKGVVSTQENEEIVGSHHLKQGVTQNGTQDRAYENTKIQSENQEASHEKQQQVGKFEDKNHTQESKPPEKSLIMSTPVIAGSALFMSIIVIVFNFIRSKNESNQRKF